VVTVENQVVAPECPRSGTFEDWFQNSAPSTSFSQVCRDKLMTLRYDPDPRRPMARRFSFPRGVTVRIPDYGKTESAPLYEPLYTALEAAGYVRDTSIRVAGYNPRLTPDMDGFLARTKRLIRATYRANGRRPVHLVGHSNGPIYAQYLLTHTWRPGGTATSTGSRRWPAISPARACSTRSCSPGSTRRTSRSPRRPRTPPAARVCISASPRPT
jgi:lysophospholipase-3